MNATVSNDARSRFAASVSRHGLVPTLLRALYRRASCLVEFEICRILCNSGAPYDYPLAVGYETRVVDREEFQSISPELNAEPYLYAFARGDQCVASLYDGIVVGHTFYSHHPTRVKDGLTFVFPPNFVYGFASLTAHSHRGHKLERSRWRVAREARIAATGVDNPIIFYVNVTNLEIITANRHSGDAERLLGYTAYAKLFGRYFCCTSPGGRRLEAGFARNR